MITLPSLLTSRTYQQFLDKALQLAESVGLPVSSWRDGDPTRSMYEYLAEVLVTLESVVREHCAGAFLDYASGDWLTLTAEQVYGVERVEATFATGTLVLENTGGGQYDDELDPGALTFKSTATGKTYHNTSGGTLASGPGTTITIDWVADEPGSDSTVAPNEIDELVTSLLEVEIQSSGAGVGLDEQTDESLRTVCRESIGALSPNGPADAYAYVAKQSSLTGVTDITKTSVSGNSTTGDVTVYLAGPSGPVAGGSVTAAADAIAIWATPLCVTVTVLNATAVPVSIELTVYVFSTLGALEADVQSAVIDKLQAAFAALPIGGDDGFLHQSKLIAAAFSAFPGYVYNVTIADPSSNVALSAGEVATIDGTPVINVEFTEAP